MTKPNSKVLFDAIHKNSNHLVEEYFKLGGSVDVFSDEGKSPLSEVLNLILKSRYDEDDIFYAFHHNVNTHQDVELNDEQKKLFEIGNTLIRNGANYNGRASRTNRSIKISQAVKSRFPQIHTEWNSLYQRSLIMDTLSEKVSEKVKDGNVRKIRKI